MYAVWVSQVALTRFKCRYRQYYMLIHALTMFLSSQLMRINGSDKLKSICKFIWFFFPERVIWTRFTYVCDFCGLNLYGFWYTTVKHRHNDYICTEILIVTQETRRTKRILQLKKKTEKTCRQPQHKHTKYFEISL